MVVSIDGGGRDGDWDVVIERLDGLNGGNGGWLCGDGLDRMGFLLCEVMFLDGTWLEGMLSGRNGPQVVVALLVKLLLGWESWGLNLDWRDVKVHTNIGVLVHMFSVIVVVGVVGVGRAGFV